MSTQAAQGNVEGRNNENDSSLLSFEEIHAHGENDPNKDTSIVHTILTQDLNILSITDPGLNESANFHIDAINQEQSDEGNISTPLKQEPNMSIIVESDISESIEKLTIDATIQEEPKTVTTSTPTTLDKPKSNLPILKFLMSAS
ncbi:unnamed protein product [Rotaria magnacalcarata]|uniref:Uncharacterized protein n=1 Tax=Rotaria magnacalcarata TaxID=392030 RepID=A0A819X512_9BILA|nr:unnamed protein product [Rotaria magnacalcarata]